MLDLTLGPSFKVRQWFTGFGDTNLDTNLHRCPMCRSSYMYFYIIVLFPLTVIFSVNKFYSFTIFSFTD